VPLEVSENDRREFAELRRRVRASQRATSAPLLTFGLMVLAFAAYAMSFLDKPVHYMPLPSPLYWPVCSLIALLLLWGMDRLRSGRTGVGESPRSYARVTVALVATAVAVVFVSSWLFFPARLLLWPPTVLLAVAVGQRNKTLTVWAGVICGLVVAGSIVDLLVRSTLTSSSILGIGGLSLLAAGIFERIRERRIA
jgi:hypothetical protein